MPISLKNLIGSGQSIEIGECVMMQDQPEPIIELDGMTFLKSGNVLADEEEAYPEAYEKFGLTKNLAENWVQIDSNTGGAVIWAVRHVGGVWFATVYGNFVTISTDGLNWSRTGSAFSNVTTARFGAAYGAGVYVIAGENNRLRVSNDAHSSTWDSVQVEGLGILHDILFADGVFVGVGAGGRVATSVDGYDWAVRESLVTSNLRSVAHGDGLFVVVGGAGTLITSPDGINWTQQTSSFGTTNIEGVAYGDGLWVAVGSFGTLATSPDGINWTLQDSGFGTSTINSVSFGDGLWVVAGNSGKLATSPDGIVWTLQNSGFGESIINSISYGDGLWIAAGQSGKLAVSLPAALLGLQTLTQDGQSTQYMRIK